MVAVHDAAHAATSSKRVQWLVLGGFVLSALAIGVYLVVQARADSEIVRASAVERTRRVAHAIETAQLEAFDGAEPLELRSVTEDAEQALVRGEFVHSPTEALALRIEIGAAWRECGELDHSLAVLTAVARDARERRQAGHSLTDMLVDRSPADPRCEARVCEELARTWFALNHDERALDAGLLALHGSADDAARRATRHVLVARILQRADDVPGSVAFLRESLRGPDSDPGARWEALDLLAQDSGVRRSLEEEIADARVALVHAERQFVDEDPRTAKSRYRFASLLHDAGPRRYEESLREYEASLAVRRARSCGDSHVLSTHLGNYGLLLKQCERLRDAEPVVSAAYAMRRRLTTGDERGLATLANNLGVLRQRLGDLDGAESVLNESLAMRRRMFPDGDSDVAQSLQNLAWLMQNTDRMEQSVVLAREAVAILRRVTSADDLDFAIAIDNLGGSLTDLEKYEEAEKLTREALAIEQSQVHGDHVSTAQTLDNLGVILYRTNRLDEAEAYFLQALGMRRRLFGAKNPDVASTLQHLAWLHEKADRYAQAEERYREAAEAWFDPVDDPVGLAKLQVDWAECVRDGGDPSRAVDLYRVALQTAIGELPRCSSELVDAVEGLAISADMSGRHPDAEDDLVRAANAAFDTPRFPPIRRARIVDSLCNVYDFWPEDAADWDSAQRALVEWRGRLADAERD